MAEPITNAQGQVAIRNIQDSNSKTVIIESKNKAYIFAPQHQVSMGWVDPEDVPFVLSIVHSTCNCANGSMKPQFGIANSMDVSLFLTGERG